MAGQVPRSAHCTPGWRADTQGCILHTLAFTKPYQAESYPVHGMSSGRLKAKTSGWEVGISCPCLWRGLAQASTLFFFANSLSSPLNSYNVVLLILSVSRYDVQKTISVEWIWSCWQEPVFLQVKNKPHIDCTCPCIYYWSSWHGHASWTQPPSIIPQRQTIQSWLAGHSVDLAHF